jgi:hypothetical protein
MSKIFLRYTLTKKFLTFLTSLSLYIFKNIFDIYVTEYGTVLTTILPILFLYLNTVTVTAGTFEP